MRDTIPTPHRNAERVDAFNQHYVFQPPECAEWWCESWHDGHFTWRLELTGSEEEAVAAVDALDPDAMVDSPLYTADVLDALRFADLGQVA